MSLPTPSDVHVNRPLTNMSVAYMQALSKFQADNLCPIMASDKRSNTFFKFTKDYWFRDEMKKRGVGAPAPRAGYGITTDSFECQLYAIAKQIDDQVRANEDTPLNSDRNAMQFVTRIERLNREKSFKTACWGTGIWATDITGNTSASAIEASSTLKQWNDAASTPIDDMAVLKMVMEKKTGFTPNVLAVGAPVWAKLMINPQILDRISGGTTNASPAMVTRQLVAQLFEIDEVVVLSAVENTAAEGATFAGDYIFGKAGLLMHRDTTAGIETATACRTITWQQYAGNVNGTRILKWRDESVHSDIVEIESTYTHKVIASDLGIYLTTLVA
jgi:hypothetical protein